MFQKILGAQVGLVGQLLIVHGLEIGIEGGGYVGALHAEEQLALLHVVVEAGFDVDHATIGEGDYRDFAGDVGEDCASGCQLRGGLDLSGDNHRKFAHIVLVDGDQVHVVDRDDLRRRRCAIALVFLLAAGQQTEACGQGQRERSACMWNAGEALKRGRESHWITSRPTARFNCPAAVR